jgi:hypothetical protein
LSVSGRVWSEQEYRNLIQQFVSGLLSAEPPAFK